MKEEQPKYTSYKEAQIKTEQRATQDLIKLLGSKKKFVAITTHPVIYIPNSLGHPTNKSFAIKRTHMQIQRAQNEGIHPDVIMLLVNLGLEQRGLRRHFGIIDSDDLLITLEELGYDEKQKVFTDLPGFSINNV